MLNVLRRDLSVVGPRPEQPRYVEELSGSIPFYDLRHLVLPGFGRGVFLDHATGFVVGATAIIEDNVSILQNVTLGGTGKESATGIRRSRAAR